MSAVQLSGEHHRGRKPDLAGVERRTLDQEERRLDINQHEEPTTCPRCWTTSMDSKSKFGHQSCSTAATVYKASISPQSHEHIS